MTHLITGLSTGGAEMMLLKLIRQTRDRISHSVISLRGFGTIGRMIESEGAPVRALNLDGGFRSLRALPRISNWLTEFAPDVVQGWMYHGNIAASLTKFYGWRAWPVCWTIRCMMNNGQEKTASTLVAATSAFLSHSAVRVMYNSARARASHEAVGFRRGNATVIPNGFDLSLFKPDGARRQAERARLAVTDDQFLVGQVARLHPMKDPETFLNAAIIVSKLDPNAVFLLAGREVPDLCRLYPHLADRVRTLGARLLLLPEQSDVAKLLTAFDAFALTSAWGEGFPNALGEAMAVGLPCIGTDVGDCAEILGDCGTLIPPRSSDRLSESVVALIRMAQAERAAIGARARNHMEENFSIGAIAKLYEAEWTAATQQ